MRPVHCRPRKDQQIRRNAGWRYFAPCLRDSLGTFLLFCKIRNSGVSTQAIGDPKSSSLTRIFSDTKPGCSSVRLYWSIAWVQASRRVEGLGIAILQTVDTPEDWSLLQMRFPLVKFSRHMPMILRTRRNTTLYRSVHVVQNFCTRWKRR